jgi:hypothetical protein
MTKETPAGIIKKWTMVDLSSGPLTRCSHSKLVEKVFGPEQMKGARELRPLLQRA